MRKLKNDELDRLEADEFIASEKLPIVVVLDNIRSMHNVGSAFRTADAFAIEKIYLCGITAQPPHRDIHKTALGATETVSWEYAEDTAALCDQLKLEGYQIAAIEQADESISLEAYKLESDIKLAVIFGNEVFGVEDKVIEKADFCLEIPQFGTKHSLNVSVSLGIVLWDMVKKIKY